VLVGVLRDIGENPMDVGHRRRVFWGVRRDVVLDDACLAVRLVDNVGKNARFGPEVDVASGQEILQNGVHFVFLRRQRRDAIIGVEDFLRRFTDLQRIQLCVATHGDRLRVQRVGDAFESADRIDHHEHRVLLAFHHPEVAHDVAERLPGAGHPDDEFAVAGFEVPRVDLDGEPLWPW